ncbi:hypothetical protein CE91St32_09580 [Gordonibacter pamelaeae]|nr:hypothetical protein CE91St32_09580 [Gordonibacter pamelaeae]
MSCGYACIGCGRCRGKPRALNITAVCFRCGHENPPEATTCEQCNLELPRLPGPSQAATPERPPRRSTE